MLSQWGLPAHKFLENNSSVISLVINWILKNPAVSFLLITVFCFLLFFGILMYVDWKKSNEKVESNKNYDKPFSEVNKIESQNNNGMSFQDSHVHDNIFNVFTNGKKEAEAIPEAKEIVFRMGLALNTFEKKFQMVLYSKTEENIDTKFNDAASEIYNLFDDFLPNVKSILKNSDEIAESLGRLNRSVMFYGATLQKYIQQQKAPFDSVYMKTGGREDMYKNELSLKSDNGEALSGVRKQLSLLRKQLKENL